MVQRLLQVRAHLILCFRAEEKVEMVRDEKTGKMVIVPKVSRTGLDGWAPVTEKNLPFELTTSFLLTADAPGMPKPIKLQSQHRPMFPLDQPIDEESGKKIAIWASGGAMPDDSTRHIKAIETAVDMDALKHAFQAAYKSAKDDATQRKFKEAYDSRKAKLGEATT